MTRVSLREAYDNKDVIAQIYAIRDTAESAEDTAEQAVTTANTASDHVDALVPQVEGAVQNANSASASAQASAQTVAGYDGRLTVAEGAIDELESDVNAVTLRVTTAEGQIVTIQGRVTALETADGQNVKINRINDYAVGLTDNQTAYGVKTWKGRNVTSNSWVTHTFKVENYDNANPVGLSDACRINVVDANNTTIGCIRLNTYNDGHTMFQMLVKNANGTDKYVTLATGDAA